MDRLGFRRLVDQAALRRLDRYIRSYRPAVVHAQLEFANIAGLWLARRYGAKVVTTHHNMIEPHARLDRTNLRHRLERWSIGRRADRIICVLEALPGNCRANGSCPQAASTFCTTASISNGSSRLLARSQRQHARHWDSPPRPMSS